MTLPFSGGLLGFGSTATQGASPFHWVELGRKKLTADGDRVLVTGADADTTFTDDFSSDDWTDRGSNVGVSGGAITWSNCAMGANNGTSRSITTLSNTKWVMRFKFTPTAMNIPNQWIMWAVDTVGNPDSTGQDGIGVVLHDSYKLRLGTKTDSSAYYNQGASGDMMSSTISNNTTYYIELARTSATNARLRYFSDENYSTQIDSDVNVTITSNISDLDNLSTGVQSGGSSSRTMSATLDDLKIYNGVSSVAGDFASKPYIQILAHNFNTGAVRSGIRFNEDDDNNYTGARSVNGSTTQSDNNGISSIRADTDVDGSDFTISTFMNDPSVEKLGTLYRVHQSGSGATNAPEREEMAVKWANSTESIGKVESHNKEDGSFASGSECIVLGYDPDAVAGTQFWEQLKSVELSSSDGSNVAEFNGSSSYSSIGGSASDWKFLSDGSAWTISFWFNDDSSTQNSRFFSTMNDNSGSNRGFSLTHDSTNIGIGIYDGNASAGYPFASQTSIFSDTGAWHLYTITYDGGNTASSSEAKVYKDASLIGTITQGRAMSGSDPNHTPLMGKRTDNQRYVDGKLQQFLIYKRELSASDVTALYNSGTVPTSPSTTNLYAWYKFASNMNDSGSGGNNGDNNNISISTVMPNTLDSGDFSTSISHDFGGDDITALTWTELGSSTSDASYVLENSSSDIIDIKNSGNNVAGSFGYATLPSTLSSTAWLMRFKLVFNTVTAESSGGKSFFSAIRITDSGTSGEGVGSEDGFGFWFIADAGSTQTQFRSTTNGSETYTGMSYTPASGNTIYVEISYSSGTATANFYSDSGFSSRVGSTTANATQTGTHTGLKYPQVMLRQDSGGNGVMEMELSELKIWNGSSYDISSKKYLWVQTHIPQSTTHGYLYFNGDDGGSNNNYARRGSVNGGSSDFANADDDEINWSHDTNTSKYLNLFLVNDPTKEKLGLAHYADYGGSGSGNAPNRMEFAYKWDNTSDPIKSIKLYNQYSGTTLPAGTRLIIWGAD